MAVVLEVRTEQWFALLAEAQDALTWMEDTIAPVLVEQIVPWRISERPNRGHFVALGRFVVGLKQDQVNVRQLVENEWTANGASHPLRLALPGSYVVSSENRASEGSNFDQDIVWVQRA